MPTTIRLVTAHPKELIRAGLRSMLEKSGIKIVGEAVDATSTVALVGKHRPAVVLLDVAIPGGDAFELVMKLAKDCPAPRCVLLTVLDNPTYMARARAIGATDCLLLDVSREQLVMAIQNAVTGQTVRGAGLYATITAAMEPRQALFAARDSRLTSREAQVLSHVALGLSNNEIARSLKISVETVKEHVQNMLRKLGVSDRTQAAVWAVKSGMV